MTIAMPIKKPLPWAEQACVLVLVDVILTQMHKQMSDEESLETQKKLDELFDLFDDMFRADRFEDADKEIEKVDIAASSVTWLLGVLTATIAARTKLKNRPAFFQKVKEEFERRGETDPRLLFGLE